MANKQNWAAKTTILLLLVNLYSCQLNPGPAEIRTDPSFSSCASWNSYDNTCSACFTGYQLVNGVCIIIINYNCCDRVTALENRLKALQSKIQNVQTGKHESYAPHPLQSGSGWRYNKVPITFGTPYLSPPSVVVSIWYADVEPKWNWRIQTYAESITKTGFTLVYATWADSKIYNVNSVWVAVGK